MYMITSETFIKIDSLQHLESFRYYYIHYEDYVKRFLKTRSSVSEKYEKALKVQISNEVALRQVVRKWVSF